ncbi:MAG: hypothetical protein U1F54_11920 [Burkholderiales bacterium]
MRLRWWLALVVLGLACSARAAIPASEQAVAIEYYHAALDHYFITADPKEIADLDTGIHVGWARTGYRFAVIKAGSALPGTSPVCRFYSFTLDTHFYSAKPSECEDVRVKFPQTWTFESAEVSRAFLVDPATGVCPADTTPVYRLYNNRPDANHRYTDQIAAFVYMKGKGYIPEGDGSPALPVAFCTPAGNDSVPLPPAGAPVCTILPSASSPVVGSTLVLTANCANSPTAFLWTGCTGTQAACTTTRSAVGTATYTLYAANAKGPAAPVTVNIDWKSEGPPPPPSGTVPYCGLTASPRYPAAGSSVTLTATCAPAATSLLWQQCDAALGNCSTLAACANATTCTTSFNAGALVRYIVTPSNSYGTGPWVETGVEWQNSAAFGGFCGSYARVKMVTLPWGSTARINTQDYGGFSPETVFVLRMTVPPSPPTFAAGGYTSFAEYNGPPALRALSLSTTPCDFRTAVDPTGANGPLGYAEGTAPIINWNVGASAVSLAPGATYYFNVRSLSCPQDACDATTTTIWPH